MTCDEVLAWADERERNGMAPLVYTPEVFKTMGGTMYLKKPGFCLSGYTSMVKVPEVPFLAGLGDDLTLNRVITDTMDNLVPSRDNSWVTLDPDLGVLPKHAGQLCYASFGENRTSDKDIDTYMHNILDQRHTSILEHAQVSFMVWGVSRSCVMEWDRQRHLSWSQQSQRYCDENNLRFVMRPEFQESAVLSNMWEDDTDYDRRRYLRYKNTLIHEAVGHGEGTKKRKAVNQAARAKLTNDVEVVLMVSGNLTAWRHFLQIRGSGAAEPEIRILAAMLGESLHYLAPSVFQDMEIREGVDGWPIVTLAYGG